MLFHLLVQQHVTSHFLDKALSNTLEQGEVERIALQDWLFLMVSECPHYKLLQVLLLGAILWLHV